MQRGTATGRAVGQCWWICFMTSSTLNKSIANWKQKMHYISSLTYKSIARRLRLKFEMQNNSVWNKLRTRRCTILLRPMLTIWRMQFRNPSMSISLTEISPIWMISSSQKVVSKKALSRQSRMSHPTRKAKWKKLHNTKFRISAIKI